VLSGAASSTSDRLLDAFLRLTDTHGSFQEAVINLKQNIAEALAAIHRHDGRRLASALRSQRKVSTGRVLGFVTFNPRWWLGYGLSPDHQVFDEMPNKSCFL
jgi:hypothetical protein